MGLMTERNLRLLSKKFLKKSKQLFNKSRRLKKNKKLLTKLRGGDVNTPQDELVKRAHAATNTYAPNLHSTDIRARTKTCNETRFRIYCLKRSEIEILKRAIIGKDRDTIISENAAAAATGASDPDDLKERISNSIATVTTTGETNVDPSQISVKVNPGSIDKKFDTENFDYNYERYQTDGTYINDRNVLDAANIHAQDEIIDEKAGDTMIAWKFDEKDQPPGQRDEYYISILSRKSDRIKVATDALGFINIHIKMVPTDSGNINPNCDGCSRWKATFLGGDPSDTQYTLDIKSLLTATNSQSLTFDSDNFHSAGHAALNAIKCVYKEIPITFVNARLKQLPRTSTLFLNFNCAREVCGEITPLNCTFVPPSGCNNVLENCSILEKITGGTVVAGNLTEIAKDTATLPPVDTAITFDGASTEIDIEDKDDVKAKLQSVKQSCNDNPNPLLSIYNLIVQQENFALLLKTPLLLPDSGDDTTIPKNEDDSPCVDIWSSLMNGDGSGIDLVKFFNALIPALFVYYAFFNKIKPIIENINNLSIMIDCLIQLYNKNIKRSVIAKGLDYVYMDDEGKCVKTSGVAPGSPLNQDPESV